MFGFQWHLTDRCNCRCKHCYQTSFGPNSECNFEQLKEMADKIFHGNRHQQVSVNLTGGEPFLYPYLINLVEHLHSYTNLEHIHIITNGTIYNPDILRALGNMPKLDTIKISIESSEREVNDLIRGAGNFQKVNSHIDLYRKWIDKPILLMITLSRYNLDSLDKLICYANKIGAKGIILERFVPLGQGLDMRSALLSPMDWHRVLTDIANLIHPEADPLSLIPYHAFFLPVISSGSETPKGALCNLGKNSMALMPDGTVFPCRRLPMAIGNLRFEPFSLIIKQLTKYEPSNMRRQLNGSLCGYCGIDNCIGCRALAFCVNNDLFQDDPACPFLAPN